MTMKMLRTNSASSNQSSSSYRVCHVVPILEVFAHQ